MKHRLDTAVPNRRDNVLYGEPVTFEPGANTADLEGKVCVAAADNRQSTVGCERLDLPAVFGMFAVDFDRIEGGVALFEHAVAKRMGDDRDTVMVVS